jgi:hypothetical protein
LELPAQLFRLCTVAAAAAGTVLPAPAAAAPAPDAAPPPITVAPDAAGRGTTTRRAPAPRTAPTRSTPSAPTATARASPTPPAGARSPTPPRLTPTSTKRALRSAAPTSTRRRAPARKPDKPQPAKELRSLLTFASKAASPTAAPPSHEAGAKLLPAAGALLLLVLASGSFVALAARLPRAGGL